MADTALAMRLLEEAVAANPKGKAGVASRLIVSRALISRILSPNDGIPLSKKLTQKIINAYHLSPECPATRHPVPRSDCERLSRGPAPTHNPAAMQRWKACQHCPFKPEKEITP